MRSSDLSILIFTASSVLVACGGAEAPPKDENDAVQHASSGPSKDWSPSTAPSAVTAPPPSADVTESGAKKASSGDLVVPTGDDPWMAPHQIPSSEVNKTMRAAQGKVNACWNAARKRDSSVSGEVKIKFVITHEGSVRVWRNEDSTVSDEGAINCVGEVVKALRFPTQKSPGDAWGTLEIKFGG